MEMDNHELLEQLRTVGLKFHALHEATMAMILDENFDPSKNMISGLHYMMMDNENELAGVIDQLWKINITGQSQSPTTA